MVNTPEELSLILDKLNDDALFTLSKTVTQGLKKSNTKQEAISNIIKYSPDEISILRRKVVTKEILFNYLDNRNIKINLPTTKNLLIDKIAEIWSISRLCFSSGNIDCTENLHTSIKECEEENFGNDINQMAHQFAIWFYNMLNSGEFGAEHFFPDAQLKFNMFMNEECHKNTIENNPKEIVDFLIATCQQNKLYLNPNDSQEGLQGRIDPHGLVVILVCGTLHSKDICVGVFEQIFALARDPTSDNNWKIKNTEINLHSKNQVNSTPRLCDSEFTSKLLMLPSE
ncbi:uncharacterized protein C3orf38 [Rhynchophorus ferrugineus]|uniref:NTF2 domain-containing protein n=1 Tax=Rhynchophorus ferrugineus TaxID=354439 RepID=A0A834HN33_RHYFE|nr:hypothetical protein GWI33_021295 [Rhynchophorus ferrugineus]